MRKHNNASQVLSETLFLGRFFSLRFTSSELDATIHWLHYYLKRSSLVSLSRLEDVPLVCSIHNGKSICRGLDTSLLSCSRWESQMTWSDFTQLVNQNKNGGCGRRHGQRGSEWQVSFFVFLCMIFTTFLRIIFKLFIFSAKMRYRRKCLKLLECPQ